MHIKNTTKWSTADLRRLFQAALKAEGLTNHWAACEVEVKARESGIRGWATIGGTWISIIVRNPLEGEECMPSPLLDAFAKVFVHELGHNAGLKHPEMMDSHNIPIPWVLGLEVRLEPVKPKLERDLPAERRAHAEKKLAEWEKKTKRAQKIAKKWRVKVRYYNRVFEARKAASTRTGELK